MLLLLLLLLQRLWVAVEVVEGSAGRDDIDFVIGGEELHPSNAELPASAAPIYIGGDWECAFCMQDITMRRGSGMNIDEITFGRA